MSITNSSFRLLNRATKSWWFGRRTREAIEEVLRNNCCLSGEINKLSELLTLTKTERELLQAGVSQDRESIKQENQQLKSKVEAYEESLVLMAEAIEHMDGLIQGVIVNYSIPKTEPKVPERESGAST